MKKRKGPARKFVGRKFSSKRMKRIARIDKGTRKEYAGHFAAITHGAVSLLNYLKKQEGITIFVGRAMRPFFETVRALNERYRFLPRGKIIYIIAPLEIRGRYGEIAFAENAIASRLLRKPFARKAKNYFVIDCSFSESTFIAFKSAIKKINPKAKVQLFSHDNLMVGDAVLNSERIPRPTGKHIGGRQSGGSAEQRDNYLLFQYLLQKEIDSLKTKKK